jgi:predicted dehydrogenase
MGRKPRICWCSNPRLGQAPVRSCESGVFQDLLHEIAGIASQHQILLRYSNGARGALWSRQVAPGNDNGLKIRVYGAKGGLEWLQVNPNYLYWSPLGRPTQIIGRGSWAAGVAASRVTRIPAGHPGGYLEGFANIYREVAQAIRAARAGLKPDPEVMFPTIDDGVKGVAFIEAAVESSKRRAQWVSL